MGTICCREEEEILIPAKKSRLSLAYFKQQHPDIIIKALPDPEPAFFPGSYWSIEQTNQYCIFFGPELIAERYINNFTIPLSYEFQIFMLPEMVKIEEGVISSRADAFPFFLFNKGLYFFPTSEGDFYVFDLQTRTLSQKELIKFPPRCISLIYFEFNCELKIAHIIYTNEGQKKYSELIEYDDNSSIFSNKIDSTKDFVSASLPTQKNVFIALKDFSSLWIYNSEKQNFSAILKLPYILKKHEIYYDLKFQRIWYLNQEKMLIEHNLSTSLDIPHSEIKDLYLFKDANDNAITFQTLNGDVWDLNITSKVTKLIQESLKIKDIIFSDFYFSSEYEYYMKNNSLLVSRTSTNKFFVLHPGEIIYSIIYSKSNAILITSYCIAYLKLLTHRILDMYFYNKIHAISVSNCQKYLQFGFKNNNNTYLCLWDIENKSVLLKVNLLDSDNIFFTYTSSQVVLLCAYKNLIYYASNSNDIREFLFKNAIRSMVYDENEKNLIVLTSEEKHITVLNVDSLDRSHIDINQTCSTRGAGANVLKILDKIYLIELYDNYLKISLYSIEKKKFIDSMIFEEKIQNYFITGLEVVLLKESLDEDSEWMDMDIIDVSTYKKRKKEIDILKNYTSIGYSNKEDLLLISSKKNVFVLTI